MAKNDYNFDDEKTLDFDDGDMATMDLSDDDMATMDLDDGDMATLDLGDDDDNLATEEFATQDITLDDALVDKPQKKKRKRNLPVADDDGGDDDRDESPVKNRGRATPGLAMWWTLVIIVFSGAFGFFVVYPALRLTYHIDQLANHTDDDSIDLTSTRHFLFNLDMDPPMLQEYLTRTGNYLKVKQPESTRKIYALRVMTQHVLCVYDPKNEYDVVTKYEPKYNVETQVEKFNRCAQLIENLEDVIKNFAPNDDLFNEAIHSYKLLAESGVKSCMKQGRESVAKLIKEPTDNNHISYERKQMLCWVLNKFPGSKTEELMKGLITDLQAKELKQNDNLDVALGEDLDGPKRYMLVQYLWGRFNASVSSTQQQGNTESAIWSEQVNHMTFFINLWLNDRDQRVRDLCRKNLYNIHLMDDGQYRVRALYFWLNFLADKDFNIRNLSVTILRRITGKYFSFDPFSDKPDISDWKVFIDKETGNDESDEDEDDDE